MAYTVTAGDFTGTFNIGQKGSPEVAAALAWYIATYGAEYDRTMLGRPLADYLVANPDAGLDEYLKTGKTAYVFFHYQRDTSIKATGAGDARLNTDNGIRVNEGRRQIAAWNKGVDANRLAVAHIEAASYPGITYTYPRDLLTYINEMGI